jgi:hypothetical protein
MHHALRVDIRLPLRRFALFAGCGAQQPAQGCVWSPFVRWAGAHADCLVGGPEDRVQEGGFPYPGLAHDAHEVRLTPSQAFGAQQTESSQTISASDEFCSLHDGDPA